MHKKTLVGFGFGPIQSGLFLLEAFRSGNFSHFTVAEIDADLVRQVNENGGRYLVNIAHPSRIERCVVENVTMLNPRDPADHAQLLQAIAAADELATALPSVRFYDNDQNAVARLLGQALSESSPRPQVLYAAENHNHAAEILTEHLQKYLPAPRLKQFQALNTVIGKMSGVINTPAEIARLNLAPMTPTSTKAILVEAFNRILISQIALPDFHRGIEVFQEKPDLLPFEEAKLYGHNAIHALIGYLAHRQHLTTMAEVAQHPEILSLARHAFLNESGAALQRKYASLGEPLFTADGYRAYADDLLQRMINPNLNDLIERIVRDPQRKLGWSDRLYGTMRLALQQQIKPAGMARGAAAAVAYLLGHTPATRDELDTTLRQLWGSAADSTVDKLIDLTWEACQA